MTSNLSFEAEAFGHFPGSEGEVAGEVLSVRRGNIYNAPGRSSGSIAPISRRAGVARAGMTGWPGWRGQPNVYSHGVPGRAPWGPGGFGRPGFHGAPGDYFRGRFSYPRFGDRFRPESRRRWPWLSHGWEGAGGTSGDSSEDPQIVSWVQACLGQIVGSWVPQDGNLGAATRRAIQMFQTQAQLPSTGNLDDTTLQSLNQACQSAASTDASAATPGAPAPPAMDAASAPPPDQANPPAAPPAGQHEAPDFPHEYGSNDGEYYEMEDHNASAQSSLIVDKIPEAPFSDDTFQRIHKTIDLFEAVHTAMAIFGAELTGLLGLGVAALAPLVAWVGSFFALGAGYMEASAAISKKRIELGFAIGFAMGADGRRWSYVKRLFWEYRAEINTFDEDAGVIAQKAFNTGLATGFLQGKQVAQNPKKKEFFWHSIGSSLSDGDRVQFGGDSKSWPERLWEDWYTTAAVIFIKLYLKD
jgi:hypothetical protein